MHLSEFDFHLPEENIALRPMEPRESARLLVVRPGSEVALDDAHVFDLPSLLNPGDALVINNTRVLPARLKGERVRDGVSARIEATLVQRLTPDVWRALVRPAKRLREGDTITFREDLTATVSTRGENGETDLTFSETGPSLDRAIEAAGEMPLHPYIAAKRAPDARDVADYQTVFARETGAVAAPTAGLHFTPQLLEKIVARDVSLHQVTLHVGAGTFLPVKTDNIHDHKMHAEWGIINAETAEALNAVRARGGRIVAVGTTALRVLETAAASGKLQEWCGDTRIFITPGYRFRAVDALLTNFHLPRSTLFMLVSAFSGLPLMKRAYQHAVEKGYRFYSYGDASLLFREDQA